MLIDASRLARDMKTAMLKVRLETEKHLLSRMLNDGSINQETHDKVRAQCNEMFICALDAIDNQKGTTK